MSEIRREIWMSIFLGIIKCQKIIWIRIKTTARCFNHLFNSNGHYYIFLGKFKSVKWNMDLRATWDEILDKVCILFKRLCVIWAVLHTAKLLPPEPLICHQKIMAWVSKEHNKLGENCICKQVLLVLHTGPLNCLFCTGCNDQDKPLYSCHYVSSFCTCMCTSLHWGWKEMPRTKNLMDSLIFKCFRMCLYTVKIVFNLNIKKNITVNFTWNLVWDFF